MQNGPRDVGTYNELAPNNILQAITDRPSELPEIPRPQSSQIYILPSHLDGLPSVDCCIQENTNTETHTLDYVGTLRT